MASSDRQTLDLLDAADRAIAAAQRLKDEHILLSLQACHIRYGLDLRLNPKPRLLTVPITPIA